MKAIVLKSRLFKCHVKQFEQSQLHLYNQRIFFFSVKWAKNNHCTIFIWFFKRHISISLSLGMRFYWWILLNTLNQYISAICLSNFFKSASFRAKIEKKIRDWLEFDLISIHLHSKTFLILFIWKKIRGLFGFSPNYHPSISPIDD